MFVVLAYAHDVAARALVQRWRAASEQAALLTCADLTRAGWRHVAGQAEAGQAYIQGQLFASRTIRAVITRMPAVSEAELAHVHEDDRRYAAAEIQAFLVAWLASLECPILNRPSPCNLCGPCWSVAEWVHRARRLGVAARPVRHRAVFTADPPVNGERRVDADAILVDVVGDRAFLDGGREPAASEAVLVEAATSLTRDAGVELLRVYFERGSEQAPVFLEAGLWIDVTAERVAEAVADRCRTLANAGLDSRTSQAAAGVVATA
jgi:hypothetical protein